VFVPLTARGDRLGVLVLGVSRAAGAAEAAAIGELGAVVGGALRIAWPHTDRYERARRERRMTLAAEVQWQLLPGQSIAGAEFALSGHLEPAYSVGGDNFDWSTEADHLALSVTNGSGQGVRAALLTSLTVGALRNARRSGAGPGEQAALAGDLVHTRYAGAEYTETLVMRVGLADGRVTAVDTGSPRILRLRGSQVEVVDLEHEPPLGMFSDLAYRPQHFTLDTGDRLVMVSDGVYAARSADDHEFGDAPLRRAVRDTRLLPAEEVPKAIIGEVQRYQGRSELDDDAVVVCLDWNGRS
jgi:serine phosphatase RsbU (regulator of sigma subunit)